MNDIFNKFQGNVKYSPLTTAVGILIILASLISVFVVDSIDWVQASVGLMAGVALLGAPDPKKPSGGAGLLLALLMFTGIGTQSCCTFEKCKQKYGHLAKDSVRVEVEVPVKVPVEVTVPPDSIQVALWIDSLRNLMPNDTQRFTDTASNIRISYWKDKYQNLLHMRADYKSAPIRDTIHDTIPVAAPCPPPVIFQDQPKEKRTWVQRTWDGYCEFAGYLLLAVILILLLLFALRITVKYLLPIR